MFKMGEYFPDRPPISSLIFNTESSKNILDETVFKDNTIPRIYGMKTKLSWMKKSWFVLYFQIPLLLVSDSCSCEMCEGIRSVGNIVAKRRERKRREREEALMENDGFYWRKWVCFGFYFTLCTWFVYV